MIRTVKRVAVTTPTTVVAFEEGATLTTDYEVVGWFEDGDGYISPIRILDADKTLTGFTVNVGADGFFWGIASEYGVAAVSSATNIVTLAVVKEYINTTATTWDTFLNRWIGFISDAIEKYTNSVVAARNFTGLIENGNGRARLYLHKIPVVSLANAATTDIQYTDDPTAATITWVDLVDLVGEAQIDSDSPTFIELYEGTFPKGLRNIKLNLRCGYETIPGELQMVCIEAVTEKWLEAKQGMEAARLGVRSVSNTGTGFSGTTTYFELSERHRAILDRYRYARL